MADLKFKQNGLRVLDSRAGDVLIADPELNMNCMFSAEFLAMAEEDPQKMAWLGKKFLSFIRAHTDRRWSRVVNQLLDIQNAPVTFGRNHEADREFVIKIQQKMKSDRGIDSLRKIEKDIFFYQNQWMNFKKN